MPQPQRHILPAKPAHALLLAAICVGDCIGATASAQELDFALGEPHLDIIPRTEAELERIEAVLNAPLIPGELLPFEHLPAGRATILGNHGDRAFSQPSANIDDLRGLDFFLGEAMFSKLWVSSPSSTLASDGLGPLYNARSCRRCHINDGRGHPPEHAEDDAISMILRVSIPGEVEDGMQAISGYLSTLPDPTYGAQIQDFSVAGHPAEAELRVSYEEIEIALSDGESAFLRLPSYEAANPAYGPFAEGVMFSPRVAPQMIGLGLLEAIPAADILTHADPEDADGDGISGRPQIIWSAQFNQPMLGRFGYKAGMPTVREQTAGAFAGDIGISTAIFPDPWGDCSAQQMACREAPHGDSIAHDRLEVDETGLDLTTFYTANLGVPARRDPDDPEVLIGRDIFHEAQCAACHVPAFVTHRLEDRPEQSFQLIWPYTDLLLHDMGEGLADNRPEARASGREWRTPPLWGIGLTEQVSGHSMFLHDGRARNLLEAILWHGGEAEASRDAVISMPREDREALIRFLESL